MYTNSKLDIFVGLKIPTDGRPGYFLVQPLAFKNLQVIPFYQNLHIECRAPIAKKHTKIQDGSFENGKPYFFREAKRSLLSIDKSKMQNQKLFFP